MAASCPREIPVYPTFAKYKHIGHLTDCQYLCEDDSGGVAFISEEAKKEYLKKKAKGVQFRAPYRRK